MEATDALQPKLLGAYRMDSLLGRGGMGDVYLAYDERLRRHVAIKRLRDGGQVVGKHLERFKREARAVARLNHPAIVQVHDILDTDEGHCIVMEYVEGSSLSDWIAKGPLDLAQVVDLGREIADGLAEAHDKGLIHRDLKSENVIVTPAGHPKILDFGLALPLWRKDDEASLTASGMVLGTVRVMSPEQVDGGELDHRADLFSLGVLFYEMLTGISPFRGTNPVDTLRRVMMEEPKSLAETAPATPAALVDLITRLLAKDARHRPQDAHQVVAELNDLVLESPSTAAAINRAARRQAERSRGQAEMLIHFMLGDLWQELREKNQFDVLASVGEKVLDYFAALDESEMTEAARARYLEALALVDEVRPETPPPHPP